MELFNFRDDLRPSRTQLTGLTMKNSHLLFITGLLCLLPTSWASQQITALQAEQKELLDTLLLSYDTRLRPAGPNGTDKPVSVKVNMLLRDVTSISDYDMDFGVQILLRQEWLDERLKFETKTNLKYLIVTDNTRIWTPDIFIQNEKDSELHKLMNPNTFIRIFPDGHILYSARLSLQLWCHMNMERFPFDTQICSLKMASYGLTTDYQKLSWKEPQALQISIHANIMGFTIGNGATSTCSSITNTGQYSCLKVDFPFKRDTKYYIYHTFLPSMVLVVVSWASFWLDRRAVVARILIVLSTLFAMSSLAADIEASVPHVPYVKAMDQWIAVCFLFLLAAVVEFVLVNSNILQEEVSSEGTINVDMKPLVHQSTESSLNHDKSTGKVSELPLCRNLLARLPKDPHRLDSVARRLFPTLFFAFLVLYFLAYLLFDGSSNL